MRSSKEKEQSSRKKRLKIFVDANTIISGLVFEGNEALLMKLGAVGACSLVTTRYVMDEVSRVLRTKEFGLSEEEALSLFSFTSRCVNVYESVKAAELHQYLDRLRCDVLVTGGKELLQKVTGAKTTRQALDMLLAKP